MKTIFLSFKLGPYYDPIKTGEKIFEYRSRFGSGECIVYLYLTAPVQKVVAKLKFGERIALVDWKEKYKNDSVVLDRVIDYINSGDKYAIPILEYQEIEPIHLNEIKELMPDFKAPRSYYIIDDKQDLVNLLENRVKIGEKVINDFVNIRHEAICIH